MTRLRSLLALVLVLVLSLAAATALPARHSSRSRPSTAGPAEAVVSVQAVRGFQGLHEWRVGSNRVFHDQVLGGPYETSGVLLDLRGRAPSSGRDAEQTLHVLTTARSVHHAQSVHVVILRSTGADLPERRELSAEVIAVDGHANLALLRIASGESGAALPRIRLGSPTDAVAGREVLFVRNDGSRTLTFRGTILSSECQARKDPLYDPGLPALCLSHDLGLSDSGGAILDAGSGRLLGLMAYGRRKVSENNRTIWKGPSYGIPLGLIESFLEDTFAHGGPRRGRFPGDERALLAVDEKLAALQDLPSVQGYLVLEDVAGRSGSPLLRAEDVVLRAGDRPLGAGGDHLGHVFLETPPGEAIELEVLRDGHRRSVPVTVAEAHANLLGNESYLYFQGLWLQDLLPRYHVRGGQNEGVVVVSIQGGTPASGVKIYFRDVIVAVFAGGVSHETPTIAGLRRALADLTERPAFDGKLGIVLADQRYPNAYSRIVVLELEEE